MTVFKGYMKVMTKTLPQILMYFAIFLGIFFMISMTEASSPADDFSAKRLSVAVIDRDGGKAAKGLMAYIGTQHDLVSLPDDNDVLQEALFYRTVEYIAYIPENFEQVCLEEQQPLEVAKVPDSYTGFYVDQCIDRYMNQIQVYLSARCTMTESIEKVIASAKETPEVKLLDTSSATTPQYYFLFRFLPYLMIAIMCYGVSTVMVTFRQQDIRMRMSCAPISPQSQNLQSILSFLLLGICYLLFCLLLTFILDGKALSASPHLIYHIINSALCMGISLALAFFVGMAAKNTMIITNIVNVLSLGLCFLGGVFVPLSFLSDGITKVAQFLPVYWYEIINDTLVQFPVLTESAQTTINQGILIQSVYIVALLCVGLVIGRFRSQNAGTL